MGINRLPQVSFEEFLGDCKNDRRIVEYVKTLLQWVEIAEKFNKLFIVQGGFAVELAAGKVTRDHDDLDILVISADVGWFKERFLIDGYKLKYTEGKDPEQGFCAYKYNFIIENCLYVDVESIYVDKDEVWDGSKDDKYVWPVKPDELFWERSIGDQIIKFLNPKVVYEFKKKQQAKDKKRDKENHDFETLERFLVNVSIP